MGPLSRAVGITLSRPPLENTERPVPFTLPVKGSNTIPSLSGTEPPSVVGTGIGLPLASKICAPSTLLKSPARKSSVGTEKSRLALTRSKVPSQSVKKKSLFFTIGPPMLPPSIFRMLPGFFFTPARFSSHRKARKALLSCRPKALPWNLLVPDFRQHGDRGAARDALLGIEV